ncbi:Tol-Pal system beta propeller repeat protein TolB [Thermomonas sp. XSG]|jgi:TolB protein|uniref:Tol-Pal system beta propeller repeat protein TolB n=1 Tax=Thermomonas sp. XSG TaxID=2771436 RepID=UPI00086D5E80|nr:Tol-Pal system beta propeller repeat protein TolB [Thermomonas sp. XSG]ODU52727.1 MAG: Tol-Pal system beta propeller repeat protein TolB [Xanthomonadaceae bacterium SCN 69-48]QNU15624.1 Tol-Pal system beta propeller repeat protein TolB [Thermomonas sp. XSG]
MKRIARRLLVPLLLLPACAVLAQSRSLEIDIVGGNAAALPITVVPFGGNCGETDVGGVVRADLGRSGQFRSPDPASLPERPTQGSEVAYPTWRMLKQDYLLIGRCVPGGDGYRTEYELFDVAKQERLLGFALSAPAGAMRDVAHQISDAVYEKILGVPGAFWTRIAYVTASGLGRNTRYALVVADSDGYNPRTVVNSTEPLLSPSWSPDGRRLAYVSFEGGNSGIWIQDIATGSRDKVTSFRGINGAPAFSPDGGRLAMTLSKGGNPDIYVMDLGSKHLTQLTNHFGIDTEPTWSHDGATLYFTSDRGGRPQIYQMPASGGSATRVSFDGSYNASPSLSSDDKKLATAQGAGNTYRIALMDRSTGGARWSMLSPGSLDESPSFAPNGAMLLYAAREGRRGVLYAVSADGRVRQRLTLGDGDVREPAWSPYRKR